ncbi:MAG TPA: CocE/NonD family hydrolase, partial [Flavisolibacter sp.]|nr:CocE/NonD family hydrolase [Flavisolibacter sp.]
MKKLLALFIISFFFVDLSAQSNSLDSAWIRDHYTKQEHMVPMRDGVRLYTAVYTPKDTSEAHPFLLRRTPYSSAPYGPGAWPDFAASYHRLYFRENYIIVLQDVRGKFMSEGEFVDVRPYNQTKSGRETDEASDTYDAVD